MDATFDHRRDTDVANGAPDLLLPRPFTLSMPDIFVWAPDDDETGMTGIPFCAFSSHDTMEDYERYLPDPTHFDEEDAALDMVMPRKSLTQDGEIIGVTDEVIAWTREVLQTPQTPPLASEAIKRKGPSNILSRASKILRTMLFKRPKASVPTSSNNDSLPSMQEGNVMDEATHAEQKSVSRAFSRRRAKWTSREFRHSAEEGRAKTNELLAITRRNQSTSALSTISRDLDEMAYSRVDNVTASFSTPCATPDQISQRPRLRRVGTSPCLSGSESRSPEPPPLPIRPLEFVILPSALGYLAHHSDATSPIIDNAVTTSEDSDCSSIQTPMDGIIEPLPALIDEDRKLPSLHFDSLTFNVAHF